MSSELDVANFALGHLGESIVPNLTDDVKAVNTVNQWKTNARERILRLANWTCAIKRDTLTVDGTAPEFGFTTRFAVPTDFIRLVNFRNTYDNQYVIEAGYILCYVADDLEIRYVYDLTDWTAMDEDLIYAISLSLAYDMAPALTQSLDRRDEVKQSMLEAIAVAKNVETTNVSPQGYAPGSWITSR